MPISDYMPAVSDVAALLRQRTVNDFSNEIGTFDATTRPTAIQAQITINQAASLVSAHVGVDIPTTTVDMVKYLVTLRAAMLIELSYFNEQLRPDKSAYNELRELWDIDSASIIAAVKSTAADAGTDIPGVEDAGDGAVYNFPIDAGGVLDWETKW